MEGTGRREDYVSQLYSLPSSLLPVSPLEKPRENQGTKDLVEVLHRGHPPGAENRMEMRSGQTDFQLLHLTHVETDLKRGEVICPMSHG